MIENTEILNSLNWRYATKSFDSSRVIPEAEVTTLLEATRLSPSSFGLQPWRAIVVTNKELKTRLKAHSWNQPQIEECSHLVVFCSLKSVTPAHIDSYVQNISTTRGVSLESLEGYKKMMQGYVLQHPHPEELKFWTQRQSYISMGFLLETAALLKIDSCPMEGIDTEKYNQILDIEGSEYSTVAVVALGYRSKEDKAQSLKKVRKQGSDIFEFRR